jgi:hypothetical protein
LISFSPGLPFLSAIQKSVVFYSMPQSLSFSQQTIHRLKKNKLAFGGLVVICLSVLVAIFGYLIAPDNTAERSKGRLAYKTPVRQNFCTQLPAHQQLYNPG